LALSINNMSHPAVAWASVLGLGFISPAPGTWGSGAAVIFWWFVLAPLSEEVQLLVCALYFVSAWWASTVVARRFEVEDAPQIVADEVVGMWLSLMLLPQIWWLALLAFGLFRGLDILKPGPIGWLDREVKGGLGVVLDDVLAGLIVSTVLYFSIWAAAEWGFVQLAT